MCSVAVSEYNTSVRGLLYISLLAAAKSGALCPMLIQVHRSSLTNLTRLFAKEAVFSPPQQGLSILNRRDVGLLCAHTFCVVLPMQYFSTERHSCDLCLFVVALEQLVYLRNSLAGRMNIVCFSWITDLAFDVQIYTRLYVCLWSGNEPLFLFHCRMSTWPKQVSSWRLLAPHLHWTWHWTSKCMRACVYNDM